MSTQLCEIIRTRLLGIPRDEQDVYLEDSDWSLILSALEASAPEVLRCALERISALTPAAANAATARELHLSVRVIADTALELASTRPDD